MNLPFAPPPGLPLPTLDPLMRNQLIRDLEIPPSIDFLPLIALTAIALWSLYQLIQHYRPKPKPKKGWRDEIFEPIINEPASPLTTTELITKIFYKNCHLAEELEPILHQIDLSQFATPSSENQLNDLLQALRVRIRNYSL